MTWAGKFSSCSRSILIFYWEKQKQVWTSRLNFAYQPWSWTFIVEDYKLFVTYPKNGPITLNFSQSPISGQVWLSNSRFGQNLTRYRYPISGLLISDLMEEPFCPDIEIFQLLGVLISAFDCSFDSRTLRLDFDLCISALDSPVVWSWL
jgi:hypothetical protein